MNKYYIIISRLIISIMILLQIFFYTPGWRRSGPCFIFPWISVCSKNNILKITNFKYTLGLFLV